MDDKRCAFARFCHRENGDAWELTEASDIGNNKEEAIRAASECPAGRLTAVDKDGNVYEDKLDPCIEIIQDPERGVSSGIYVKGGIPLESSECDTYEVRNRYVLCRCGKSRNKPFCDASHMAYKFKDVKEN